MLLAIVIQMTITNGTKGDEATEKKIATAPETIPLEITINDPDGMPIEGVAITPYALRSTANPGSHYLWSVERHGSNEPVVTDKNGKATFNAPKFVIDSDETGVVSITARHDRFIELTIDVAPGKPVKLSMQPGRRYFVTAIDADSGVPYKKRLFAQLSGDAGGNEWTLEEDGTLRSIAVSPNRELLRVFHVPENDPVLFGEPFKASSMPDDELECYLPDMLLSRGKRISGRLDDSVPRPVKNGHVVLRATNTLDRNNERGKQLSWSDWTPVREDGTFEFESVPPDQIVMLVAVCHGYLSAAASIEELEAAQIPVEHHDDFLRASQCLPMVTRSEEDVTDFVIPMLPTASVRAKVVTSDGKPLAKATVAMWPNQFFPGGGSNIIGEAWSTWRIEVLPKDSLKQPWWSRENLQALRSAGVHTSCQDFYSVSTDEEGVATLTTLPAGFPDSPVKDSITVIHKNYHIGDDSTPSDEREMKVELIRNQTTEVTIEVQPKVDP